MIKQVCPLCGFDENVVGFVDEDNLDTLTLVCQGIACEEYYWTPKSTTSTAKGDSPRTGIGEELGVYADLLSCITQLDTWLEWGVIEHLYREINPVAYKTMIDRWGHRSAGKKAKFTASSFLAGCVGQLGREGLIATRRGPNTGYWSYLPLATQAARLPEPDASQLLSWTKFSADRQLDSDTWIL